MKPVIWIIGIALAAIAVWDLSQENTSLRAPSVASRLVLIHQSNRWGTLVPCGCSYAPFGGIDREFNAIKKEREANPQLLYIDAGNALVPEKWTAKKEHYEKKAVALREMYEKLSLDLLAPGPTDMALGGGFVKDLYQDAAFPVVHSNFRNRSGELLFPPYALIEKNGVTYGILAVAPKMTSADGSVAADSPERALKRYLPELKKRSHFTIVISQLPTKQTTALAKAHPEVGLFVGSDASYESEEGYIFKETGSLLVDNVNQGFRLAKVEMGLSFPFEGFQSHGSVLAARTQLADLQKKLSDNKKDEEEANRLKEEIAKVVESGATEYQPGISSYQQTLIKLDKERFGEENAMTALVKAYDQAKRDAALAE